MQIETERLLLRPFEEADFADFYAYVSDRELCRSIGWNIIVDEASARKVFAGIVQRQEFALVLKSTGRVIGNFTANAPHPGIRQDERLTGMKGVSLSFAVSAQHQRKGYISEALRSGIDVLFRYAHVDYINCGYFDFNTASAAVQKKFGFRYFSTHEFTPKGGTPVTVIENILTREEYFASLN